MTTLIYDVVEHDGGWAYKADGVFSETFPSHDTARHAADMAARRQATLTGESTDIAYEDKQGKWHEEFSPGDDHPVTKVRG